MDFREVETLLKLLESPIDEHPQFEDRPLPADWAVRIAISCAR